MTKTLTTLSTLLILSCGSEESTTSGTSSKWKVASCEHNDTLDVYQINEIKMDGGTFHQRGYIYSDLTCTQEVATSKSSGTYEMIGTPSCERNSLLGTVSAEATLNITDQSFADTLGGLLPAYSDEMVLNEDIDVFEWKFMPKVEEESYRVCDSYIVIDGRRYTDK